MCPLHSGQLHHANSTADAVSPLAMGTHLPSLPCTAYSLLFKCVLQPWSTAVCTTYFTYSIECSKTIVAQIVLIVMAVLVPTPPFCWL